MEKEFVNYSTTLALKELGFNEPCFSYYKNDQLSDILEEVANSGMRNVNNQIDDYISAPLYQQTLRWLRVTHNIDVDVVRDSEVHYQDETRWIVKVSDWNDIRVKDFSIAQLKFPNHSHHTDFKSYEEALEKGLEEALKFIQNERI